MRILNTERIKVLLSQGNIQTNVIVEVLVNETYFVTEQIYAVLFASFTGDETADTAMKKSVSMNYTIMLLLLVVRNCENMETLEKFGARLVNISDQGVLYFLDTTRLFQFQRIYTDHTLLPHPSSRS